MVVGYRVVAQPTMRADETTAMPSQPAFVKAGRSSRRARAQQRCGLSRGQRAAGGVERVLRVDCACYAFGLFGSVRSDGVP
jgi:hypothetical protein